MVQERRKCGRREADGCAAEQDRAAERRGTRHREARAVEARIGGGVSSPSAHGSQQCTTVGTQRQCLLWGSELSAFPPE